MIDWPALRTRKYGISPQGWQLLHQVQGYRCALCRSSSPNDNEQSKRDWHLDHDHACCGKHGACRLCLRGLLCARCNIALGLVEQFIVRGWVAPEGRLAEYLSNPPVRQFASAIFAERIDS